MAFHSEAARLIERPLEPIADAVAQRSEIEARLGCPLPGAVAELVTSDAWPELYGRYSLGHHPVPRDELGDALTGWGGRYAASDDGLLVFMIENQGVCVWAVDTMPRPEWMPHADSFSAWFRCQVHDALVFERAAFCAQAPPVTEAELAQLRSRMREGERTHGWPWGTTYRFENAHAEVILSAGPEQCDWFVAPRGGLVAGLDAVPGIARHAERFYALSADQRAALEAWRRS